jgi:hypothetical protein
MFLIQSRGMVSALFPLPLFQYYVQDVIVKYNQSCCEPFVSIEINLVVQEASL